MAVITETNKNARILRAAEVGFCRSVKYMLNLVKLKLKLHGQN